MPDASEGSVRVRFAPSPTGALHIGGVRTALFNWLYARHTGGTFLLRIEDTDVERSTEASERVILDGLKWLGLDWDEGSYRQSERLALYREHVAQLLARGQAYRCICTPEELDRMRRDALARKETPRYDGRCREREIAPDDPRPFSVRFAAPHAGQTIVHDLLRGEVTFANAQLDDLIILRSDRQPTYNLSCVVDDSLMKISHVIRGDDHLNNTPRQLQLYAAFGYQPPKFAHIPMILGPDKTRLSKRHGATSILDYRNTGYLPQALVNYLVRLGWAYGDQEVFTRDELIEKFTLEGVGRSAAVFNPEKLLWLNGQYLHRSDPSQTARLLGPFLSREGIDIGGADAARLSRIVIALKERSRTLVEMAQAARPYLSDKIEIDPAAAGKFLTPATRPFLEAVRDRLGKAGSWEAASLQQVFHDLLAERGWKMSQVAQPVRVAITGRTVSPGIFEVLEIVGRERALARLDAAIASI